MRGWDIIRGVFVWFQHRIEDEADQFASAAGRLHRTGTGLGGSRRRPAAGAPVAGTGSAGCVRVRPSVRPSVWPPVPAHETCVRAADGPGASNVVQISATARCGSIAISKFSRACVYYIKCLVLVENIYVYAWQIIGTWYMIAVSGGRKCHTHPGSGRYGTNCTSSKYGSTMASFADIRWFGSYVRSFCKAQTLIKIQFKKKHNHRYVYRTNNTHH